MRSSNVIRHHDYRPLAVVVGGRDVTRPEGADRARPEAGRTAQRAEVPANPLTDQARRQAAEIVVQAEAEAEAIASRAREEGWQEGYREGREAGEASCRDAVEELVSLASRVRSDTEGLLRSAESQVLDLALAVARKLVEAELAINPSSVEPMVRAALHELADATVTRVRVHPDSLSALAERWCHPAQLVPDADLAPGDCIVDTSQGALDARIETKLDELSTLLRNVRSWEDG